MSDEEINSIFEKNNIEYTQCLWLFNNFYKKIRGPYISFDLNHKIKNILMILKISSLSLYKLDNKYCCSFFYKGDKYIQQDCESYKEAMFCLISKIILFERLY